MLIHLEKPDNKRKFVARLTRDEMELLRSALVCYGDYWDDDKAWEIVDHIEKLLASTRITIEDMLAEEAALNKD